MKQNLLKYFGSSLWISILFFILGAVLFTNPGGVVEFVTYLFGGLFLLVGLYKLFLYYRGKKKNTVNNGDLIYGVAAVLVGIIIMVSTSAIETVIRFVMGAWILYTGVTKVTFSLQLKTNKIDSYKPTLIVGLLMILFGLYIVLKTNLVFKALGLCIMIYSALEIIQYVLCAKSTIKYKEIQ